MARNSGSGRLLMRSAIPALASLGLSLIVTACNWFDDPSPDEARLMIDGPAGAQVRLITSTKFLAAVTNDGVTRVEVFEADTTNAALPFESTYAIRDDQAFLAWTSHLETSLETIRVRVFLDAAKEFDESGPLKDGIDFRFVYTFNQRVTPIVEITL